MAATESGSTGPRYAPEDPTLPKPWRALVDGATGYLYYWNPEMNITQYEKPTAARSSPSGHPSTTPKLAPVSLSSTVQSGHGPRTRSSSHHSHHKGGSHSTGPDKNYDDNRGGMTCNEGRYSGGNDSMVERQPKLAPIPAARNQQGTRSGSGHQQNVPSSHSNGSIRGSSNMHGHGPSSQAFSSNQSQRSSARMHSSLDTGNASSPDAYRREHEISVTGENVPAPFITFDQTGFPTEILREVHSAGFSVPTPIQAQTWPIALQSRDIVAIAKTGSGKTLGYLVPGFIHLKRSQRNSQMGPSVLVLSPTRELATQIQDEARKFGRSSRISCTCLYGGAPKGPQLRELDRGVDIVVATPGRLNDIIEMKRISLRQVSYLVLDEADRMLDMGFEPQIRKIVNEIPPRRQTLMYTATWPKEVRKIAGDLLVNPVQVNIGNMDELAANKSITQYVEVVPPMEKQRRLEQILRSQEPGSKVLIFCSTKRMCDQLARSMSRQFGAAAIHGDKSQGERDWVLNQFRNGKSPILVATDVAARGLDIKDIRVVINYDFPTGVEDYVHRIGRTGRAGATGVSYTFFSEQDRKYATDLVKVLEGANQRVPPEIRDMAIRSAGMHKGRGRWDYGSRHANRETSRTNGGRSDGHGRWGGRGTLSGNLDRGPGAAGGRGGGRTERSPPHDRRGRGHPGGHDVDANGRHGRGFPGRGRAGDRDRGRSHSRSYSPTSSPGHRWGFSHSRSRSHSYGKGRSRSRSRSRSPNRFGGGPPVSGRSPLVWGNSSPVKRDSLPLAAGTHSPYHSENAGADLFHSPSPQQQRSPDLSPRRSGRTPVGDLDHSPEQHPWGLMQDMDVMAEQVGSSLPVRQRSQPRYQDDDSGEEGMITPDGDVGSSGMMMQDPEPVD